MCTTVVMPDGRWLHSPGELEAEGFEVLDSDDFDGVLDRDACMCGVDAEAIVTRSGRPFEVDDVGFILVYA